MNLISSHRNRPSAMRRFILIGIFLILSGCGSSPGKSTNYYMLDFNAAPETVAKQTQYDYIKIDIPYISSTHTTESILYSDGQYKQDAYSQSEWMVALPALLQNWLIQSLDHMQLYKGVMRAATRANIPLILETDIVRFEHVVYENAVVVTLRISILDYTTRSIIKQKTFQYKQTVAQQSAVGAVTAFNGVLEQFNVDLFRWLSKNTAQ